MSLAIANPQSISHIFGEEIRNQNTRKTNAFEKAKPEKRVALCTITNTQHIQKEQATKVKQATKDGLRDIENRSLQFPRPFQIYMDPERSEASGKQKLNGFVTKPEFVVHNDETSPMLVSPCHNEANDSDIEEEIKDGDNLIEYKDDILKYLKQLEVTHRSLSGYMNKQPDVTENMRAILVDWLVEVAEEFDLKDKTLYLSVSFVDRFLSVMSVSRSKLQLVGTACMMLAAKVEEIYPPEVADFVYVTDDTYTKKQLLRMELLLLKVLGYNMSVPTAYDFLEIYLQNAGYEQEKDTDIGDEPLEDLKNRKVGLLARYICELTLLDSKMLIHLPSIIALSSICLAESKLGLSPCSWFPNESIALQMLNISVCIENLDELVLGASTIKQQSIKHKYRSINTCL